MIHILFLFARIFPYFAVPLAILCFELGFAFRRKGKMIRYFFWLVTVGATISTAIWIYFRGDINSDIWIRSMFAGLGIQLSI